MWSSLVFDGVYLLKHLINYCNEDSGAGMNSYLLLLLVRSQWH